MSRARIIKPEFFTSRSLSQVSRDARLLFQGLWCEADAAGRGKADPRIVKGAVFPLDDDLTAADVADMLLALADTGHLTLYEVDGEPLYEVVSFAKHQSKAYRSGEAKYPEPTDETITRDVCTTSRATCTPDVARREGKGREGKSVADATDTTEHEERFDRFWTAYPRKTSRKRAHTAWRNMTAKQQLAAIDALPAHISRWRERNPDTDEFIPHAATWLNQERWEDEIGTSHSATVEVDGVTLDRSAR